MPSIAEAAPQHPSAGNFFRSRAAVYSASLVGMFSGLGAGLAARVAEADKDVPFVSSAMFRGSGYLNGGESVFLPDNTYNIRLNLADSSGDSKNPVGGEPVTKDDIALTANNCHTFLRVGSLVTKDKNTIARLFTKKYINKTNGTAKAIYYLRRRKGKHFKLCGAGIVATLNNNDVYKLKLKHKTQYGGDVTDSIVYGPNGFSALTAFVTETH